MALTSDYFSQGCRGLGPRESVSHMMPVDSYTKAVIAKDNGGSWRRGGVGRCSGRC